MRISEREIKAVVLSWSQNKILLGQKISEGKSVELAMMEVKKERLSAKFGQNGHLPGEELKKHLLNENRENYLRLS